MTTPHPALLDLAGGRSAGRIADEEVFLASMLEHRMPGPVSGALRLGTLTLSADASTRVAMLTMKERLRHQQFWDAAVEVQRRLADRGMDVAVLKGIATEARWYDEMGERVCTDVDLLLSPADLDRAAEAAAIIDPDRGQGSQIQSLVDRRLLQHLDLRLGAIQVDLHFDPFKVGLPTRRLAQIWGSTETLESEQGTIRVLDPGAELMLLLLHLNKDSFSMLGTFLDVARILERAELDWRALTELVTAEGLEIPVWSALATVSEILGIDAPVPTVEGPRAFTWRRLWRSTLGGHEGRERAPRLQRMLSLHARRRLPDQVRELRRQLMPQRELLEVAGRLAPGEPYRSYLTRRFSR